MHLMSSQVMAKNRNNSLTVSFESHSKAAYYKQRKNLATRQEEVEGIRKKFPNKIPVIVERYHKEYSLPLLDKSKFLVPQELTMSQFVTIIRNRMQMSSSQALYLIVNNKSMSSMSRTLTEVHKDNADEDGFLYVTYASQEMFGACIPVFEHFSSLQP